MAKKTDHLDRPVVVVTGIGMVTSLGKGKTDNWAALTSGKSGIHPLTRFPSDHLKTRICGTVDFLDASKNGPSALTYELAETTAIEALGEAGLDGGDFDGPLFLAAPPVELSWRDRFDLYQSSSEEEGYRRLIAIATASRSPRLFDATQFGAIADRLAERFRHEGIADHAVHRLRLGCDGNPARRGSHPARRVRSRDFHRRGWFGDSGSVDPLFVAFSAVDQQRCTGEGVEAVFQGPRRLRSGRRLGGAGSGIA